MRRVLASLFFCLFLAFSLGELAAKDLVFPRISVPLGSFTGVALSNTGPEAAQITLTLFGSSGQPASVGASNPRIITLASGQQSAFLVTNMFAGAAAGDYWLRAQSDKDFVTGFVLFGDNNLSTLDGFSAPPSVKEQVLPFIQQDNGFQTTAWLVNPSAGNAHVEINSTLSSGIGNGSQTVTLTPGQQFVLDLGTLQAARSASYLRIVSDLPISAVETVFNQQQKTLVAIPGFSRDDRLAAAFIPHFATGGGFTSEVRVINQADQPVVATITAFKPDGSLFFVPQVNSNPVTRAIPAHGSLHESVASFFGFPTTGLQQGWLRIETNTPALSSFVTYGTDSPGTRAAVVSQLLPLSSAVFPHQANAGGFFTGLGILNQTTLTANITIASLRKDGSLVQSVQKVLVPGQRLADLVSNLLPAASSVNEGLVWIRSDVGIFMTEIFGTAETLANVPADAAAPSYNPDAALARVSVSPALVPLEVGSSVQFKAQVSNAPNSQVVWSVNGVPGGNAQLGTVSATGVYKTPAQQPIPQVLTIEAKSQQDPSRSSGSTVEILRRQTLGGTFSLPRAVAYIDALKKLYVAELTLIAGKQPLASGSTAVVSEVTSANGERTPILSLPNELIEKMVPFNDRSGVSYLLMAGHETGQIYTLRIDNHSLLVVASGFNKPSSLALDPISGDLLVTEEGGNGVRVITRATFDPTAVGLKALADDWPALIDRTSQLFPVPQPGGVSVDRCSGLVYVTDKKNGCLLQYNRATGEVAQVLCGLVNPGEIQGLYRNGLYCSGSYTLFLGEEGDGNHPARILQIIPNRGIVNSWLVTRGTADLAWLRDGNPYLPPVGKNSEDAADLKDQTGARPQNNAGLLYSENLNQEAKLIVIPLLEIYRDVKIPEIRELVGKRVIASGQVRYRIFQTPIPKILMLLSNDQTALTDSDGFFQFTDLPPGTYEVTPKSKIFSFNPPSRVFTVFPPPTKDEVVNGFSVSGLDFLADTKTYSISGTITDNTGKGIGGVSVTVGAGIGVTNSKGNYTISGLIPGTYLLQPFKQDFTFRPPTQMITILDSDVTAPVFIGRASPATFYLSGTVTNTGIVPTPAAGIQIHVCPGTSTSCPAGPGTTTVITDSGGKYSVGVANGDYTIEPTGLIYDSFSPPFVNVTVSGADKPGQDFTRCPGCLGKR